MARSFRLIFCALIMLCSMGCVTSRSGTRLEGSQVNTIKKGVTTRAKIEKTFGAPINVSMLSDGRRAMHFSYNESRMKGGTYVPFGLGGAGADT